jgi:hypothetical protein
VDTISRNRGRADEKPKNKRADVPKDTEAELVMSEIITGPPQWSRPKIEFVTTILMFTVIGWIPVMLLVLFLGFQLSGSNSKLPQPLVIPALVLAAVPGFMFGLWFASKMLNKQYWQLTDTELSCGMSRQQKFPLASVEKVIIGLPVGTVGKILQQAKPGTVAGASVNVLSTIDPRWNTVKNLYQARAVKENSLLICFKDGSWLPLRLFLLPNGSEIMDELRERLKDRLIENYKYSAEEIRRLRKRDVNELIPAPKHSQS